jgi:uncharacterized repeat protein (TIGR02543 family)/uncharacterized repeat protein (TIGR01451 family)
VFADVDNDGIQEVVAGRTVYKVTITNRNGTTGNAATVLAQAPAGLPDGFTAVADIDQDGDPDVIVTGGYGNNRAVMYVWDGATSAQIGNTVSVSSNGNAISRASIGDINGDKRPEIVFTYVNMLVAYRYNPANRSFGSPVINLKVSDSSGATGISLFDFDQNGKTEIVYRDNGNLYIIENGILKASNTCTSDTHTEYPVIVDLDRDGHADILVSGKISNRIYIIRYGHTGNGNWAPARPVWNQYGYNSINITDRLRVPAFPPNPAAVFPGPDGQLNTADDIRPFNNFMQQQAPLDFNGVAYWPKPDLVAIERGSFLAAGGNGTVTVGVSVFNNGNMTAGSPVYATFYNEYVSSATKLGTAAYNSVINPGDTAYIEFTFSSNIPVSKVIARVNDNSGTFPVIAECEDGNNELSLTNMKKDASIDGIHGNGTYGNPVSVLYGDIIQYKITAYNVSQVTGTVIIRDTLPAYLNYIDGSAQPSSAVSAEKTNAYGAPQRDALEWVLSNIASRKDTTVSYRATPAGGVCASQPLFINRARITSNNTIVSSTNSTFHQGAGVSILSFSASFGGSIYNAEPQVLDYKTSARAGVLTVPDEGYAFTGWSHDDYYSLRGERIPARSDIIHYDTLLILGDVELTANFELIDYPIRYYLNEGENAGNNPQAYTIWSGDITLEEPRKDGDVFVGWTGSNGADPQMTVTILEGTTGELEFYANYLHSGREEKDISSAKKPDKIWSAKDELFIRTSTTGSIVRIYSPNGMLTGLHTILSSGVTKIKLQQGIYIVTLNNGIAQKVIIK